MSWLLKRSQQEQYQIKTACLLLRYRCTEPTATSYKYFSYNNISKALKVPYNTVQYICRRALEPQRQSNPDKEASKLEEKHVDFLTSYETLEEWAGFTLKFRTILFHRKYGNK